MTLFVLGFMLLLFQPDLETAVSSQANRYVQEIELGNNLSENVWALSELYQESCSQSVTIQRIVKSSSSTLSKKVIDSITCGSSGVSNELLQIIAEYELLGYGAYLQITRVDSSDSGIIFDKLSSLGDPEYEQLLKSIINRNQINLDDISSENVDLIANAIIYSYQKDVLLSVDDQNAIIERNTFSSERETSIIRSLQLSNASFLLFDQNRFNEFSSLHESILSDEFFPNTYLKVRYTRALAYVQYTVGRYDLSLELHRYIIEPVLGYYGYTVDFEDSRFTQAVSLYSLGKFREAKEIFEQFYYDSTSTINRADLFNNLSVCYLRLGEKNQYINYLLEALDVADSNIDYANRLTILSNLFFYYTSIGDKNTALEYLDLAEEIARENNDRYQIANIHAFTGIFYWQTENDVQRALEELRYASNEFDPETDFFDYTRTQKSISQIYIELDSLGRAKEVLQDLNDLAARNSIRNAYLESLIGLLEISIRQSSLFEANEILEEIALYTLDDLEFKSLVKYNILLADYQFLSGKEREAYENLRPVVDQVMERARTSIDSQTGFWVQEKEYIDAFNTLLNILVSTENYQEAVQLLDEIKTINDAALYNSPILRANKLSEEDLAKDQLLNYQISNLRESFLYARDSDQRLEIKNEIDQLSAQREEILNKIRQDDVIESTPIWVVQNRLNRNQQIVHFTEVGDLLYISFITRNAINIEQIEFKSADKALFSTVADQIALSRTNLIDLHEIYDLLKLEAHLIDSDSDLIIIPDNYLYRIPLEILPISRPNGIQNFGSTTYLIEEFNFEYFTSLHEFHTMLRGSTNNFETELSAFAISDFSGFDVNYLPTLPFASQEVRSIADRLDSFERKNLYLENNATKSTFLNEVSDAKIVHIATHSEVSEQDPLFSTIFLNDDSGTGGSNALYAYELFDQRLNSELIMLNSCSSGSGDYLQGSGIMGITRALRYAGAKSMALNLWAVNDKVAYEFASVFYGSINEGRSKSEAMRDAKLFLLQNGNANPHYWGAFMLTGNPSQLTKKPTNAGFMFPILLVLIGGISLYLRRIYSI